MTTSARVAYQKSQLTTDDSTARGLRQGVQLMLPGYLDYKLLPSPFDALDFPNFHALRSTGGAHFCGYRRRAMQASPREEPPLTHGDVPTTSFSVFGHRHQFNRL